MFSFYLAVGLVENVEAVGSRNLSVSIHSFVFIYCIRTSSHFQKCILIKEEAGRVRFFPHSLERMSDKASTGQGLNLRIKKLPVST